MSRPVLTDKSSHREIHKLAYHQAERFTNRLQKMWVEGDSQEKLLEIAYQSVEHWETTTLAHALEEEKGIYVSAMIRKLRLTEKVLELAKEHQLMRVLVHQIKTILDEQGVNNDKLSRFDTLLLVNEFHNYKEENRLLGHELMERKTAPKNVYRT